MDDETTDTAAEQALTRRGALAAGAAGVAGIAVATDVAGAATKVSAARYNRTVIVHAPRQIVFNLEKVQAIQEDILGQLGCQACCSGFDFHFPDELEYLFPAQGVRVQEVTPGEIVDAIGEDASRRG